MWGLPLAVVVLVPAALDDNPVFVSQIGSFNVVAVYAFVAVGTAAVLSRVAVAPPVPASGEDPAAGAGAPAHQHQGRGVRTAWTPTRTFANLRFATAMSVAVALLVTLAFFDGTKDSKLPSQWELVSGPASATLSQVLAATPADAEVIAAQGVVGRFGARRSVYAVLATPQAFPVQARNVVFVLTPAQGIETVSEAALQADIAYVQMQLHATPLASADGVYAFSWHPPARTRSVVLSGTP